MVEQEKKILEICGKAFPKLKNQDKERLLAFMEGMAFMASQQKQQPTNQDQKPA